MYIEILRTALVVVVVVLSSVQARIRIFVADGPIRTIGTRMYREELLTDRFSGPKELAYDSASRNLFFMYMDDELQNSGRALVNVVTKRAHKVKGIARNRATAVDADTGDVYFGSEDGLYRYEPVGREAAVVGLYNTNILKLVVRNNEMYLIDANNHMIYKVFNGGASVERAGDMRTVMEFEVDNERNLHYVSMCGVFCAPAPAAAAAGAPAGAGARTPVRNRDLRVAYHFVVDGAATLAVTRDALYRVHCANGTATRLADMSFFPVSIIFGDYGDIYYSIDNSIYRLRPVSSYLVYNLYTNPNNTTNY